MTRLLSSVVLAGALALSMSTAASARDYGRHGGHGVRHAPVCKMVTHCDIKRTKWGRMKRVCITKRVCGLNRGHGHH